MNKVSQRIFSVLSVWSCLGLVLCFGVQANCFKNEKKLKVNKQTIKLFNFKMQTSSLREFVGVEVL